MNVIQMLACAFLLQIPLVAFASDLAESINISVKFDHSFYELKHTRDQFSLRESGRTESVRVRDCNRVKLDKIASNYRSLLKNYSLQAPRARTQYDVELVDAGNKVFVARGSDLGTWLRDMPKKVMYITAEAQASCKK